MVIKIRFTNEGTVFTLPWDVAHEKGYFREEGIDAEVFEPDPALEPAPVFERPVTLDYEVGELEAYNKCEWGVIKRAADGERGGRIIGKRESVASMAIVVRGDSPAHRLDDLAGVPVAIQDQTGSHYTALKMLEGHVADEEAVVDHIGGPVLRTRALLSGEVKAANLMELFISLAESRGCRVLAETKYWGLLYSAEAYDEASREALFRALRKAVDEINRDLKTYAGYLLRDIPEDLRGDFSADGLNLRRLTYVYPQVYTEEEFNWAARFMAKRGLKPERDVAYADVVQG
ncbi:MAG: ABC transporter substrate-binding protein [Nitrospinota bacterium]